jgi:CheY-like chemotaxis protein
LRILIIDDYPPFALSLQRMLIPEHTVEVFTRAAQALARLLEDDRFDLVLCDLAMAELSGPDLLLSLRAQRPALAARVAFMTGGAHTAEQVGFLQSVPNPCLEKPFARSEVERLLAPGA